MSYGITPIAVSIERVENVIGVDRSPSFLARLFGSPTDRLIHTIRKEFDYRFDQFDEDEPIDDDEPTLEQALADLLAGNELDSSYGHQYAYALELLCQHFGEVLDNSAWSAMQIAWAEHVDEAAVQAGIDKQALSVFDHLMDRGSPIAIPRPDDWPLIGFLRRSEMADAARAIDSADLSSMDEETKESLLQIRGWLRRCSELNCDLVCFYY